ncbi:MAG: hypothetical protein JRN37_02150 [Nitrososphaerota archaeon]|nr:hypothetical protein [Nitrososphaerota archaeon]MDG7037955.1 hypothetical protein [Nitrososphaerota archaeon]
MTTTRPQELISAGLPGLKGLQCDTVKNDLMYSVYNISTCRRTALQNILSAESPAQELSSDDPAMDSPGRA